jgi:hypothetical protein
MSPGKKQDRIRSCRRAARLWYSGFICFLGVTLLGSSATKREASALPIPAAAEPVALSPEDSYSAVASPRHTMDEAVHLIETARDRFRDVRDYSCRLVQRERVGNKLPPETVMGMEVRTQPFSIHLKWYEPRAMVGQEAIYVVGKNSGKMRVRGAGLLGAVGFINLDVDDARARRSSRHNITEAGLGNLIEQFAAGWPNERRHGQVEVHISDFAFADRPCTRVETIHPANPDCFFMFGRSVVYFDKQTDLPVRVENYDWPKQPGRQGDLLEEYSYLELRLNAGLGNEVFDH